MNPLIQLNKKLQYLFIALLLACFAITQSARAIIPEANGGDSNGGTVEENNALPELNTGTENGAASETGTEGFAMGRLTPQQVGPNKWIIKISFTDSVCDRKVTVQANLVVVGGRSLGLEGFKASAPNLTFPEHKFTADFKNQNGEVKYHNIEIKVDGAGPAASRMRFVIQLSHIKYRFRDGKATNLELGRLEVFCLQSPK